MTAFRRYCRLSGVSAEHIAHIPSGIIRLIEHGPIRRIRRRRRVLPAPVRHRLESFFMSFLPLSKSLAVQYSADQGLSLSLDQRRYFKSSQFTSAASNGSLSYPPPHQTR